MTHTKDIFNVFVFDLDNTLYLHNVDSDYSNYYHKQVKHFLQGLKAQNKILCIATHNKNPDNYLKKIGILDLFDHIISEKRDVHPWMNSIYDYTNKNIMIQEIIDKTQCKKEEVLFFDDAIYNIECVQDIGVKSIKVSDQTGIAFKEISNLIL